MQVVFVCGGRGTRLERHAGAPKSLALVGGATLLDGLVSQVGRFHASSAPPVVVVDEQDHIIPEVVASVLPSARIVRQPEPDGVANALLLAQPFIDDLALVTLGDLFLDGTFRAIPPEPALMFWAGAHDQDTRRNFGIAVGADGVVESVIEKPIDAGGLRCGMGVYVIARSTISCFREARVDPATGERGITDGIQAAIESGVRFRATPFVGFYCNVNSRADVVNVDEYAAGKVR